MTSLQKITRADVVDLKNRLFCRQRLKISIVGDIDTDGAEKLVDQLFGDLPSCTGSIQIKKAVLPAKPFIKHIDRAGAQTSLIMAQEGISRQDKDWWAARILDFTIGGGDFSSRLMQEIRVKGGMTYGISSSLAPLEAKPLWFVQAGLDPAKAVLALQKIKQIWSDVAQNGLTPEEIAEAKSYLINTLPLSLTTTDQIAGILLQLQEDGLPIDTLDRRANEINAVTSKHIQNVARTRLDPNIFSIVTIGPKK
jgi:zinc protease